MKKRIMSFLFIIIVVNCFSEVTVKATLTFFNGEMVQGTIIDANEEGFFVKIKHNIFFIKKEKITSISQNQKEINIEALSKMDFVGKGNYKVFDYIFTKPLSLEDKMKANNIKTISQKHRTHKKVMNNILLLPISVMMFAIGNDYHSQSKDLEDLIELNKDLGLSTSKLKNKKSRTDFVYISSYIASISSLVYSFSYKKVEIKVSPKSVELSYKY